MRTFFSSLTRRFIGICRETTSAPASVPLRSGKHTPLIAGLWLAVALGGLPGTGAQAQSMPNRTTSDDGKWDAVTAVSGCRLIVSSSLLYYERPEDASDRAD